MICERVIATKDAIGDRRGHAETFEVRPDGDQIGFFRTAEMYLRNVPVRALLDTKLRGSIGGSKR